MTKTNYARLLKWQLLLALLISTSGCSSLLRTVPPVLQPPPPDPALMQSPSATPWSQRAADDIQKWLELLANSPTK